MFKNENFIAHDFKIPLDFVKLWAFSPSLGFWEVE